MNLRDCRFKTVISLLTGVLIFFVVLETAWLLGAKHYLNKYYSDAFVENKLNTIENTKAEIKNIYFEPKANFSLSLSADKINISESNTPILNIENVTANISILHLLASQIHFELTNTSYANINVIKDKNGQINLLKFIPKKSEKNITPKIKKLTLNTNNYKISFDDKQTNYKTQIEGKKLQFTNLNNKFLLIKTAGILKNNLVKTPTDFDINISGNIPFKKNLTKENFDFNILVNNLDLRQFIPLRKYIKFSEIEDIEGLVNVSIKTEKNNKPKSGKEIYGNISTKNIFIKEKLRQDSTFLKEKADINFDANIKKGNIFINKFNLKTKNHDIRLDGQVLYANTYKPLLDLKLRLHNDEKSMIYNLIPSEIKFENGLISKIKKYMPIATIDGEVTIKGDCKTPDIEGEFHTDNLFINQPIANEAKAKLKLIFKKKRLQILADVIPNAETTVLVDGTVNIYGEKNAEFFIKSDKNVNLKTTKAVLIPIQDTFSLNFGILNQILVENGYGDAVLNITGTRQNAKVNGNLNFYATKGKLKGINKYIDDLAGQVDFSNRNIYFETSNAKINSDNIKINGTADLLGNFDINLASDKIKTQTLLDTLVSSELLAPIKSKIKDIEKINYIDGISNIKLNINGKSQPLQTIDFEDTNYSGNITINNNNVNLKDFEPIVKILKADGTFQNNQIHINTNAEILNSQIQVQSEIKNNKININAHSNKFFIRDLLSIIDKEKTYHDILKRTEGKRASCLAFNAAYHSHINNIDLKNLYLESKLFYDTSPATNIINTPLIYTSQGEIKIENGNAVISNLFLYLLNSDIALNGIIRNIFSKKPDYNLDFELNNFDLDVLNNTNSYKFFNSDIKKIMSAYEKYRGKVGGNLKIKPNNITGKLLVRDIGFSHKKMKMPVYVSSADAIFNGNSILINSLNGVIDEVPIFASLQINNLFGKQTIKGYTTSNLYPSFINKFVNANIGYPIKLKGEVAIKSYFQGSMDSINSKTTLLFPIGTDISYMGSTLGDKEFIREINLSMNQNKNKFHIDNATYSRLIKSQNGTFTKDPFIKVSGNIELNPTYANFNNFNIKTFRKTSSSLFNILFKKSILKYGDFECDLNINGKSTNPELYGFINFRNLDIPLYETLVKDILIDFKQQTANLKLFGKIYDTNIVATADIENKFSLPIHIKNIKIDADYLNLENIFNSISKVTMKNQHSIATNSNPEIPAIPPTDIIIDNGSVQAKKILIKGFPATDLNVTLKQSNGILKFEKFHFTIAEGKINAKGEYNFSTNKFIANCVAKSIDANQFVQIFLNLKNQLYGDLDGTVSMETQGVTPDERLKHLNATVLFNINDGRMTKLGSLEYLLRAANIVKSGITGFTANSIIELLVPIKTGNFSIIKGDINIKNGHADSIKIYSKGKNLSLYITGSANLSTQISKLNVYGRLAKNVTTVLGPIGNTSINTLFNFIPGVKLNDSENTLLKELNKIPGLEFSNNEYRFFHATIDGDVNGDDYVQSFKWLK